MRTLDVVKGITVGRTGECVMSDRVTRSDRTVGATTVDRTTSAGSTAVDLLALLRQAVRKHEWTNEALAAHLGVSDRSYPHKLLHGDKSLSVLHLGEWPENVVGEFGALVALAHGRVVAEPASCAEVAAQQLVAGLLGLLASRLPERASNMASAQLKQDRRNGDRRVG